MGPTAPGDRRPIAAERLPHGVIGNIPVDYDDAVSFFHREIGWRCEVGLERVERQFCSSVGLSQSGSESFRSMSEQVRDDFAYRLMNGRYMFQAPKKLVKFVFV